jgi:electron transfer flavoprotein alpha subunit
MAEYKNILVFGEIQGEKLSRITAQLLGIGKKLADDLQQELNLLVLGVKSYKPAKEGFYYGADRVYVADDLLLENYVTESYLQAMEQVVKEQKPEIVLFGQNDRGMDLAPRLAFRLRTGVTLDCIDLEIDSNGGLLKQVKPVFGGKAHCHYYCKASRPQIVSVRDRTFDPAVYDSSRTGEVTSLSLSLDSSRLRTRFLGKQKDDSLSLGLRLGSASVVVSGGRGLGKKEGFEILNETAEILGGTIAGSRVPVDNDWIPNVLQVGLTGQKISPEAYFAVGISGAIQHIVGCLKSKAIVAINKDEEAPIFRVSHYGVVGDYREVLMGFNDECRRIKEKGDTL